MSFISVCKQVIGRNNKRGWVDPDPAIRIGRTKSGPATDRGNRVAIKDREGNIVAEIISTTDGKPVLTCGAKVAIITEFPAEVIE